MAGDASSEQEQDDPDPEFVELDPSGRYGRYNMMLGKGAFKFVYKAFDTLEGIEVAWNQMKLRDISKESDDLSEVRLLQTLKHKNIIKLYCSWVDFKHENINFITEIFTSGNLRQYREKHRHVEVRALKNWARQILQGLLYLHSHDPPVIHRDLKCENIFVNGNHGEIKIGDLGLAALLYNSQTATKVIGTPEFMAPELFSENYNELVDIYAFGMCLLELVTFEYPYKECRNVAQIYKKVTSGIKPTSLANVKDLGVKTFIEKCIADASKRLSARELLMDPFLQSNPDNNGIPYLPRPHVSRMDDDFDQADTYCSSPSLPSQDFTVQGHGKDANVVFLKLRIPDSKGYIHNINFPFDIKEDTSITVASEMVAELDLTDQDVIAIAEMIDSEVQAYVPDWSRGAYGDDDDDITPTDDDTSPMNDITSPVNGVEHKPKVEESPFSAGADDSPSGHVSEQLLFGQKYWSDSPKGSSGSSATSSPMSGSSGFGTFVSLHHSIELNERQCTSRKSGSLFDPHDDISFVMDGKLNDVLLRLENENLANQNAWSKTSLLISTKPLMKDEDDDFKVIMERIGCLLIQQQKEKYELEAEHAESITSIMKGLSPQLHTRILNWCRQKLPDPLVNNEKFLRRTRSGKLRSTSAQYALPSYLLHSHMKKNITAKLLASQTNGVSSSFDINGGGEATKREPLSADRKGGFISRFGQNKANLKNGCTAAGIALILGD